jgi:hypothetical protein
MSDIDSGGSDMAELDALLSTLEAQRRHVLGILDGLDDAALSAPVLPSGWTCAGLVRHLTLDVERFWFRNVVAGVPFVLNPSTDDAWQVPEGESPMIVLANYRAEIEMANDVIRATPLGAAPKWWPDFFGDFRLKDLRAVLLHSIAETACHAGHLDAARELLDGRQWFTH